ncbi:MAG: hypothetical protein K6L76_00370 [Agarilytica sp.]
MKVFTKILITFFVLIASLQAFANTPRDPIVISSDSEFTSANGVTGGSGTSSDPYIISGWDVTTGATCITISNTTSYFVVSDNACYNPQVAGATIRTGFSFSGVTNGTVSSNDIYAIYGATASSAGENGGDAYGITIENVENFSIDNENNIYGFLGGTGYLGASGESGGNGGAAYGLYGTGSNSGLTISNNVFGKTTSGLLGGTGGAGGPGGTTGGAGGYGGNSHSVYLVGAVSDTQILSNTFIGSFGGNGGAGALGSANSNGGNGGNGGLQFTVLVIGSMSELDISENSFSTLSGGTGGLASSGTVAGGTGGKGGDGGIVIPIYLDGSDETTNNISISTNEIGPKILAGAGAAGNIGASGSVGGNGGEGGFGGQARGIMAYGLSNGTIDSNTLTNLRAGGGGVAGIGGVGVTKGGNGGSGGVSGNAYGIVGGNLTGFVISGNNVSDVTAGAGAVGSAGALASAGVGGNGGNGASGGVVTGISVEGSPSISILNNDVSSIVAGVGGIGAVAGTGVGIYPGGYGGNGGNSGDATAIRVDSSDRPTVSNNIIDTVSAGALSGIGNDAAAPYYGNTGGNGGDGGDATGIYFNASSNPMYEGNTFASLDAGPGNRGGFPNGVDGTDGVANNVVLQGSSLSKRRAKKKLVCKITEYQRRKRSAIPEKQCVAR